MDESAEKEINELAELLFPQTKRYFSLSERPEQTPSYQNIANAVSSLLYQELGGNRFNRLLDSYKENPFKFRATRAFFNSSAYVRGPLGELNTMQVLERLSGLPAHFEITLYASLIRFEEVLRQNDYSLDKVIKSSQ